MRSGLVVTGLMTMLLTTAVVATLSTAARPKQYRWTGTVTEIDPETQAMRVEREGHVWEFSTQGLAGFKAKKGDKVTVHYVTIAKKVDTTE